MPVPLVLGALLVGALAARPMPGEAVATACWLEARPFESLRSGVFDYCRGHLRYRPGAFDCYRTVDQVCTVWLPNPGEWTQTRTPNVHTLFPCPEGPEPPVCPRMRW